VRIFVTGAAGFIGYHVSRLLLSQGHEVVGFDGLTTYYDPSLKRGRIGLLEREPGFRFVDGMLEDQRALSSLLEAEKPEIAIHLAAQAGVRYSLESPGSYIQSNIVGTASLLEALRRMPVKHLIFASTSSVYGGNAKTPFVETDRTDHPVSLYAATKKAGEAMVHSYSHLWGLPTTCFRFFTVYGPYGRPDMAPIKFASAIMAGRPIEVYGYGRMRRDFTYVDDLADAVVRLIPITPQRGLPVENDSLSPVAPYRIVNVAAGRAVELMDFIAALESALGRKAVLNLLPMQPGDVGATEADTSLLRRLIGPMQATPLDVGVQRFADWFTTYRPAAT
jgi:UDP-glucuronate 4-epimerase